MSRILTLLLLASIWVNAVQYMSATKATERHAERVHQFKTWDYRANLIKERTSGNVWLRLDTPAGIQVHEFGQVCPKEIKA